MKYRNVLHIDDDQDDLEIFSTTVEEFKTKINCTSLTCAATALKKIASRELAPEVIFVDLNMPGMNGFEFLSEIKKLPDLEIPVVVLSTCSQQETIETVKELGADGYLTKPSTMKQFFHMLSPFFV